MTRKRYKKLLMAAGYSRNYADHLAERVVNRGGSYAESYELLLPGIALAKGWKEGYSAVTKAAAKAAPLLAEAIKKAVRPMAELCEAFERSVGE